MNRRPFLQLAGVAGGSTLLSTGSTVAEDDDESEEETGSDRPSVHVMATGGTIANPPEEGYYTAVELVEARPELEEIASVSVTGVSQLGSSSLTAEVLYDLHGNITEVAEGETPPDGFVVTVGSNATEEVAYFLNLTLNTEIPVAVTGAQ
jgi:L-asparaginase